MLQVPFFVEPSYSVQAKDKLNFDALRRLVEFYNYQLSLNATE